MKSRFSHRFIYMFKQQTFSTLMEIFTSCLLLPASQSRRDNLVSAWNQSINDLVKNPQIKDSLMFRFNVMSDLHSIQNLAALIIANVCQSKNLPQQKAFLEAFKVLDVDSKAAMLQGMSCDYSNDVIVLTFTFPIVYMLLLYRYAMLCYV